MKKLRVGFLGLVLILSALVFTGCGANSTADSQGTGFASNGDKKLTVYTTVYPMYDLTQKIGGDKIQLKNLVPAGTEPHDWEPTPSDMAALEKADVLIYNGAGMEPWLDKVLKSLNPEKLVTVEATQGLTLLNSQDETKKLATDPHVWLDPMHAKQEMGAIKDALVTADPANHAYYEKIMWRMLHILIN